MKWSILRERKIMTKQLVIHNDASMKVVDVAVQRSHSPKILSSMNSKESNNVYVEID